MLAETLMDGTFGRRPVTLLGFSLGARVVYFCLKVLFASSRSLRLRFDFPLISLHKSREREKEKKRINDGRELLSFRLPDRSLKLYHVVSAFFFVARVRIQHLSSSYSNASFF